MIQIPFDKIVERILKNTSLTRKEVVKMVEAKKKEMKGLVSDEGAAYIIANELGVKFLPNNASEALPLENVVPGLKRLSVNGRVVSVFPVSSFESKGRKGKVGSFLIGDGSGSVRVVLWNEMTNLLSENRIGVGDVVSINNAYSREALRGGAEIHLSNRSRLLVNPKGVTVAEVKPRTVSRGDVVRASVTHVFDRVSFFDICPECRKRVTDGSCASHGNVEPVKNLVLSMNLDNGSEIFRAVLFGNAVESITGLTPSDVHSVFASSGSNDELIRDLRSKLLGVPVVVRGKKQVNDFTGRQEIVVNRVRIGLDPVEIIKEFLG